MAAHDAPPASGRAAATGRRCRRPAHPDGVAAGQKQPKICRRTRL